MSLSVWQPQFDMRYLPASVTVQGTSMFDDNIAFAMMADNATSFASSIPLGVRLAYTLPYSSFYEPRNNWRPLFFAKVLFPRCSCVLIILHL